MLRLKRKEAESDESHAAAAAFLADFCSTVAPEGIINPSHVHLEPKILSLFSGISSDGPPLRNFSNYSVTLFKKTRT